ncbi:MAG: hypothetical protein ABI169_07785 [Chitinophagaceae bacterium]
MRKDYNYLAEKFSILIHGLVVGKGNVKERLLENSIVLHTVLGLTFPNPLEEKKEKIIKQLTKFPALVSDDKMIWSSYDRTIMKIRKNTAVRITENIYNLYVEFTFHYKTELN